MSISRFIVNDKRFFSNIYIPLHKLLIPLLIPLTITQYAKLRIYLFFPFFLVRMYYFVLPFDINILLLSDFLFNMLWDINVYFYKLHNRIKICFDIRWFRLWSFPHIIAQFSIVLTYFLDFHILNFIWSSYWWALKSI